MRIDLDPIGLSHQHKLAETNDFALISNLLLGLEATLFRLGVRLSENNSDVLIVAGSVGIRGRIDKLTRISN